MNKKLKSVVCPHNVSFSFDFIIVIFVILRTFKSRILSTLLSTIGEILAWINQFILQLKV